MSVWNKDAVMPLNRFDIRPVDLSAGEEYKEMIGASFKEMVADMSDQEAYVFLEHMKRNERIQYKLALFAQSGEWE